MARVTAQWSPNPGGTLYTYLVSENGYDTQTTFEFDYYGGITSPYNWGFTGNAKLQASLGGGVWYDVTGTNTGWFSGYKDMEFHHVHYSFNRQSSDWTAYIACYAWDAPNGITSSGFAQEALTIPHLPDIIPSLTATKVSDNRIDLAWTNPSSAIDGVEVRVSIDNGSSSTVAKLDGSPTSYSYTQASEGHLYNFSVRARYRKAWCDTFTGPGYAIATTPVPPSSISTAAAGGTLVDFTLDNPTYLATSVEYQVSTDGGATWGATQTSADTTSFSASISGTGRIRVRNVYENSVQGVTRVESAWLESDDITTIAPPNPPTLTNPTDTLNTSAGSVEFSWIHNTVDGSAQSAYELAYSTDGGSTWTTLTGTTAQSRTVSPIPWAVGTTVTWKVRTKGAAATGGPDPDYPGGSPWAQAKTFNVYSEPTLSITIDNAVVRDGVLYITGMPINLTATYSDMAGFECKFASVKLMQNGREVYPANLFPNNPRKGTSDSGDLVISGNSITGSLDISEFLPTNGESYTVLLTARSSSGLQTTENATFFVDFTEPVEGTLQVQNDLETGYVSLLASYDNTGADEPAVSISVARVKDIGDVGVPLMTDVPSDSGFVDKYAPLNTPYKYTVTTKAATGAVKTVYVDNIIESDLWFAYWVHRDGDTVTEMTASAKWNPDNGGIQVTRPQKTRVYYAGRRDPVSYDGHAVALTETPSWMFIGKDEVDVFVNLIEDGGRGIYKSCDGWVYHADFDLTLTPAYTAIGYYGVASLGITRIAGERL